MDAPTDTTPAAFEKVRHSSLEFEREAYGAPEKRKAEAPIKARSMADAYEAAGRVSAFKERVALAVHTRPLDEKASLARAMGGELARAGASGAGRAARRLPRNLLIKGRELGEADLPYGSDAQTLAAADSVLDQADPRVLSAESSFILNDVLPAGRARKRLARWDSKAKIARGKAGHLAVEASKLAARAEKIDPNTLRGRWLARRANRKAVKAQKSYGRYLHFSGAGAGMRGKLMRLRKAKAKAAATAGRAVKWLVFGGGGFLVALLLALLLISSVLAIFGSSQKSDPARDMPPYITNAMVEAALECQEDYGHPAGCTIAQIICESGSGETMSQLATRDHNLFGMKWSSAYEGEPEVAGHASWETGEEYVPGETTQVTASFIKFRSDVDCIVFRSRVFLQSSRYRENELIKQAIAGRSSDKMAEGLKDAGWATDSSYVETLKGIMDSWNLRRLDTMTVEQWRQQAQSSNVTGSGHGQDYNAASAEQKRIVDACYATPSPGYGLCAAWITYVYQNAGLAAPTGNADDMFWNYCTSSNKDDLKVGMLVAVPSWTGTEAGRDYGHVAIYIGDGLVMDNVGYIRTITLDSWIATYGDTYTPRWGFPGHVAT